MFGGQQAFQQGQGQWQQGFTHGQGYTGPPPAKKVKSNPIITRYPPPPGYRGPGVPPTPHQQQPQPPNWQYPQQSYAYGQQSYQAFSTQHYGQPEQTYPQQAYPQQVYPQQQQHYPGYNSTHPPQQYQQPGLTVPGQQHAWQPPTTFAQSVPPQQWQPPISTPQSAAVPQWPPAQANSLTRRHSSALFSAAPSNNLEALSDNDSYIPLQPNVAASEVDDLEDDYFSECYFASHPDEINQDFSLGFITWKPPLPTKRPLPATFSEAELEAIAPRKELPTDDEAISDFFICARRHDALLSVRQTEHWNEVKDNVIFREFPVVCTTTLPMSKLLEQYKDRHDSEWIARESTATPEPETDTYDGDTVGGAADTSERDDDQTDMLGNLEQALQTNGPPQPSRHSRQVSSASSSAQPLSRPRPLLPVRDQDQESILAALGVTGSPKLVYETPGPAIGPPQPPRHNSSSQHSRANSTAGARPPPPPPPGAPPGHLRSYSNDTWSAGGNGYTNGYNESRRGSNASQRTANGSDFGGDDQEKTPRPTTRATESRKRAFEDADNGDLASISEQDEDTTPRQRFKHPRVDDAFRRRW